MSNDTQISRRVVLGGLGASVALPWLESTKFLSAADQRQQQTPKRFGFLFFGDGIHPPQWWAKGNGPNMELGEAFASLESIKDKVNVINGLQHPSQAVMGHARGAAGILSGIKPKGGREIFAATSMDQILAKKFGEETMLESLVLACERPISGFHETGYSMMYASHVSWSSPVSPVPAELYPSLAFDALFESKGNKTHLSVLDHVLEQLNDVAGKVSVSDRAKIDEFTTSVREVEQRLSKIEKHGSDTVPTEELKKQRPDDGLPTTVDAHARLMCDIIALAFQMDRTRVSTLLLTNNLSGQVYPFLGLRNDHHSFSHAWQGPDYAKITRFWVEQYAYLLDRLNSMQEGDSTVLDNSCILMANEQWTAHNAPKVPLLQSGGLGGQIKTGRSLDYENADDRKLCSMYLTLMDRMGHPLKEFGNSTDQLAEL